MLRDLTQTSVTSRDDQIDRTAKGGCSLPSESMEVNRISRERLGSIMHRAAPRGRFRTLLLMCSLLSPFAPTFPIFSILVGGFSSLLAKGGLDGVRHGNTGVRHSRLSSNLRKTHAYARTFGNDDARARPSTSRQLRGTAALRVAGTSANGEASRRIGHMRDLDATMSRNSRQTESVFCRS